MGEKKATAADWKTTVTIMTQRADLAAQQRVQTLKQDIVNHARSSKD